MYTDRLAARQARHAELAALDGRIGYLRLAVVAAIAFALWLSFSAGVVSPGWTLLPAAAFVALMVWHDRVIRAENTMARAVAFYQRRIARVEDRWVGTGSAGSRFVDDEHLYARDLDVFGTGSLFELLSLARTRLGEDTLAGWLKAPADLNQLRLRQQAVSELRDRLDFREAMATSGRSDQEIDTAALTAWAGKPPMLAGRLAEISAVLSAAAIIAAGWWWGVGGPSTPLVLALLVKAVLTRVFYTKVAGVLEGVEGEVRQLDILSAALTQVEQLAVESPLLVSLRTSMVTDGVLPSQAVRQLELLAERLEWQRNAVFAPIAVMLSWSTLIAAAVQRWRRTFGPHVPAWLRAVGEYEALNSLAAYAYEHPADPFPTFVESGPATFDGLQLGHPLVPAAKMVPNDVRLADGVQLLIVSGSNMSGKSTLLRTVGVNIVMAMAGAPVRAERLTLSPLATGATLYIQDSLQAGRSRFFTEISRVKRVTELAAKRPPALFLLDEIFQGTNSHDRQLGAAAVLRHLVRDGAIGLVTTHDLALTAIAEELGGCAVNIHFQDDFRDGEMVFDYRMHPGPVHQSNALALMKAIGLVDDADSHLGTRELGN